MKLYIIDANHDDNIIGTITDPTGDCLITLMLDWLDDHGYTYDDNELYRDECSLHTIPARKSHVDSLIQIVQT